jgi:adenosine kinase
VGVTAADLVIISPNDPQAMINLADECRAKGFRFMYDPSQQVPRLSGDELMAGLHGAYAMVVNGYEAKIIAKKTGKSIDDLRQEIEILVVTHGGDGSTMYDNGNRMDVPVFPVHDIKDPTGGGDAYRAGLVRGMMAGLPLKLAGLVGALCATYVLEQVGTQNHRFTPQEFVTRFRQTHDDEGALDILLSKETASEVR